MVGVAARFVVSWGGTARQAHRTQTVLWLPPSSGPEIGPGRSSEVQAGRLRYDGVGVTAVTRRREGAHCALEESGLVNKVELAPVRKRSLFRPLRTG